MFEITFELAKIKGVIDRYAIGTLILKVEKIIITCSSLTGQFLDANVTPTNYLIACSSVLIHRTKVVSTNTTNHHYIIAYHEFTKLKYIPKQKNLDTGRLLYLLTSYQRLLRSFGFAINRH